MQSNTQNWIIKSFFIMISRVLDGIKYYNYCGFNKFFNCCKKTTLGSLDSPPQLVFRRKLSSIYINCALENSPEVFNGVQVWLMSDLGQLCRVGWRIFLPENKQVGYLLTKEDAQPLTSRNYAIGGWSYLHTLMQKHKQDQLSCCDFSQIITPLFPDAFWFEDGIGPPSRINL